MTDPQIDLSFIAEQQAPSEQQAFKVHTAADPRFMNKENSANVLQFKSGMPASVLCKSRFLGTTTANPTPNPITSSTKRTLPANSQQHAQPPTKRTIAGPISHSQQAILRKTTSRRASARFAPPTRTGLTHSVTSRNGLSAAKTLVQPQVVQHEPTPEQKAMMEMCSVQFPSLMKEFEVMKQCMQQNSQQSTQHSIERDNLVRSLSLEKEQLMAKISELENKISQLQQNERNALAEVEILHGVANARQAEVERASVELLEIQQKLRSIQLLLDQTTKIAEQRSLEIADLTAQLEFKNARIREMELQAMEFEALRRKLHNEVQDLKGNIRVFCRVRPQNSLDYPNASNQIPFTFDLSDPTKIDVNEITASVTGGKQTTKHSFSYDKVFGIQSTQEEIFEELSPLVQSVLDGYSCCIFAYGQTGSGKTFTMEGPSRPSTANASSQQLILADIDSMTPERGVIPRAVEQVFNSMIKLQEKGWAYQLEVSFLEVYNEQLHDLLAASSGATTTTAPQIKRDTNGRTYVTDCKTMKVMSAIQVYELLAIARANRAVASTKFNDYSSRSHSVFQMHITGVNTTRNEKVNSTLNLVDLAGSERLDATTTTNKAGDRQKETQNINLSLHHLRNVITALAGKEKHIPYRSSALTQLLQPYLGGEAKMLMFVNVSPSQASISQSLSSLRFATTANKCHIGTVQRQATSTSN